MRPHAFAALALALSAAPAGAYPLDASPETGIARLEAFRLGQKTRERRGQEALLPQGALLPMSEIVLSLQDRPNFEIPPPDPALGAELRGILGADAGAYSLALLDLSDPARPLYAGVNPDRAQIPGSVGKIVIGLAFFQSLADAHPKDLDARRRVLRETQVTADGFIRTDDHEVPFWKPGDARVERRPIEVGDTASLYTWLDWMLSSSSNAAGSEIAAQLVLLEKYGASYPPPPEQARAFLDGAPKSQLSQLFLGGINAGLAKSGLDRGRLYQGSLFTREGKARIPGAGSTATAGELLRFIVRIEQGRLVDPFSSLEMKRLLYLTDHRVRYASQPALADSALYFKSGSLYSCQPERGFTCSKFHGNRLNYMNSVVLVETPGRNPPLRYAVAVLSNVLKKDSAEVHAALAADIHRLIEARHPETPIPTGARRVEGLPWRGGSEATTPPGR